MERREFITLLGGTVASWPLAARAQQPSMPVIGFLHPTSLDAYADRLRPFREGLKDAGFIEGENVAIEYRWAENQTDRLPALAAELARRQVAVIAAPGPPAALAAKAATTTIPIVFLMNEDPVRLGLVANLARPGGNATGINFFNSELAAKRLRLLHDLVPTAVRIGVLVNPANIPSTESTLRDIPEAARAMGLQIQMIFNAATIGEIDAAFASVARERADALFVAPDIFFVSRAVQFATLTARDRIPATFANPDHVAAGGLMSYGTNITDAWRQVGVYVGRILKGAKAADLPVVQPSKFELVINAETARMLDLAVPSTLLARADEVIE
jgi:putative tryptophan/tyrosine transport system substrate-binding protein